MMSLKHSKYRTASLVRVSILQQQKQFFFALQKLVNAVVHDVSRQRL